MPQNVYIIGAGMTKFEKPGARESWSRRSSRTRARIIPVPGGRMLHHPSWVSNFMFPWSGYRQQFDDPDAVVGLIGSLEGVS